eukprot:TRINITY_DN11940_c0_g4_i1.p1 TRINITY_DN11940_c0_g4~~TRINITY_DN11940_c0_g4_i1.p1  ORF type:complete len:728 (+),score=237.18 TRINITY_DN11940_c0_g4_i1:107-2185(+)
MATAREQLLARVAARRGGTPVSPAAPTTPPMYDVALASPARQKPQRKSGDVFSVGTGGSGAVSAGRFADCVGFDLGSASTCVAAWDGQAAKALSSFQYPADKTVPSCVAYASAQPLVGIAAYKSWAQNASTTVGPQCTRWLGRAAPAAPEKDGALTVVPGEGGMAAFSIGATPLTAEAVYADQLRRLLETAVQDHVRGEVRSCVLAVPVGWDEARRQAARRAAEQRARLSVREVITDAEACVIACGVDDVQPRPDAPLWVRKTAVVCDFGASALNVSVVRVGEHSLEVAATGMEPAAGGDALDAALLSYFLTDAAAKLGPGLKLDEAGAVALEWPERIRFLAQCRGVKEALAGQVQRQQFDFPIAKGCVYQASLTKIKLESMIRPMMAAAGALIDRVLGAAGVSRQEGGGVTEVIVAGGMAKMPRVLADVRKLFAQSGAHFPTTADTDQLAAQGAAIKAAALCCTAGGGVMPPRVPVVAQVCGQTFGVACAGDEVAVAVYRNEPYPAGGEEHLERIMVFRTSGDNQSVMDFHIVQGSERSAARGLLLATLRLSEIPQRPRGETEVVLRLVLHSSGSLIAVCWVQGAGHLTATAELTLAALHSQPLQPLQDVDPAALPVLVPVGDCVHISSLLHVVDVPKDAEDIRLEEARDKEWRVAREKERRERKAKMAAQRQQREAREALEAAGAGTSQP